MAGLSVSDIVNVTVNLAPLAAPARNFGALLIAGPSPVINMVERSRIYTTLAAIAGDFGTNAPEYLQAAAFFSQNPTPNLCYVGRWAKTATNGLLLGQVLTPSQQAILNYTSITSGGFGISIDGVSRTAATVDLSGAANLNAVAAIVTSALSPHATCTWNATRSRFEISSATTGASSSVSAAATNTTLAIVLGIEPTATVTTIPGFAAETPAAAAAAFANATNDWYGLIFADSSITNNQHVAVATFIEAATPSRVYGVTSQSPACYDPASTTDLAYILSNARYRRTFIQFSSTSPYAAAGLFGRAFTVNFGANNATITLFGKNEAGLAAENLSETGAAALKAKNCNVFANYSNATAIIQFGTMADGSFFDEVHGLDWLQNRIQTDVFNLFTQSPTKIPQTEQGIAAIVNTIAGSMNAAVNNGLVGPGTWTVPGFGKLNQGDYLPTGYYIFAVPLSTQASAERAQRKAPPISVAAKLAGAVHSADVIINVNR